MVFELGKCYRHTSGEEMKIVGIAKTTVYGMCYVGETNKGDLRPVGFTEDNALNWVQISEEHWEQNFS